MNFEFHPLADIFPLIEGADFQALVSDIAEHGLIEPILLLDGKILDGRNRYRACREAEIEPSFESYDGDNPLAFVVSLNLRRRHLDESQRAMVAARLANLRDGQRADQAAPIGAPAISQDDAATMLNVGRRSVQRAREVLDHAEPQLRHAVDQGKIAVSLAAGAAKLPAEQQRQIAEKAFAGDANAARTVVKKARRQQREAELGARHAALPDKRYGCIVADPEWLFEPYSRDTGMDRAAENHYPTSATRIIAERDVRSIAADDSVLFLWATAPMLLDAIDVMESWGFTYKSNCVWVKDKIGTGYWFRNQHEHLLVGTRGNIPAPAMGTQWPSVIEAPASGHSAKPAIFMEMIEAYYPTAPKIELNCRGIARPGWDAWGYEAEQPERDVGRRTA